MPTSAVPKTHYEYDPSKPAAIIFAILYVIECFIMLFQIVKYRTWIWSVMFVAAIMEAVGYIARIISIHKPTSKGLFIFQFTLIVLAPVLVAAAYYVTFGRIVNHVLPKQLRKFRLVWVPTRFITLIFVGCDIIAFILQAWGAILVASSSIGQKSRIQKGKRIVLIGLGVQIACFGYFCFVSLRAGFKLGGYRDLIKRNTKVRCNGEQIEVLGTNKKSRSYSLKWILLVHAINVGSFMVLTRSIYRVCEFGMGKTGYIEKHEWMFYVFDALPIICCFVIFNIIHPGRYLPNMGFRGSKQDIWAGQDNWVENREMQSAESERPLAV